MALESGSVAYVATYESIDISPARILPIADGDAALIAQAAIDGPGFSDFENPVVAVAFLATDGKIEVGIREAGQQGISV